MTTDCGPVICSYAALFKCLFQNKVMFLHDKPLRGQPQLYYYTFSSIFQCLWRCVNGLRCPCWGTDWLRHSSSDSYEQTGTNSCTIFSRFSLPKANQEVCEQGLHLVTRERHARGFCAPLRTTWVRSFSPPSLVANPRAFSRASPHVATRNEVVARRLVIG